MEIAEYKRHFLSYSDVQHRDYQPSENLEVIQRPDGFILDDIKAMRKRENPQSKSHLLKNDDKRGNRGYARDSGRSIDFNRYPNHNSLNRLLSDARLIKNHNLIGKNAYHSEAETTKRAASLLTNSEVFPTLQHKYSMNGGQINSDRGIFRKGKFIASDDILPQILTKTTVPRGMTERRDIQINLKERNKISSFLKRQRKDRQNVSGLVIKMGYYLHKLHYQSKNGSTVVNGDYMDHFQKNYQDLRKLKNDKLIIDYHLKVVTLPPCIHRQILILDLDETLIHCCNFDNKTNKETVNIPLRTQTLQGILKFNVRPGVDRFLKSMADHYQIVVFTASDKDYAKAILRYIDPSQYICKLMTRDSCSFTRSGHLVKDLRIFLEKDISRMVLVDNSSKCSIPQLDNAIPILPFINNTEDRELDDLGHFLVQLAKQSDIPLYLKEYFKMHRYADSPSHHQLLDDLVKSFPLTLN
jgi:Dullard-like phosphatase family protein